tara:strand:- start:19 stop:291 length:273 start_codon:yes stop_codon:yes gene_type:complete
MSDSVENAVAWTEIQGKFDRMIQSIDMVKDKQDEMADDIGKIKEAVYNPDSGLYARLRELESWKSTSSRLIWIIITTLVSLTAATIYKLL